MGNLDLRPLSLGEILDRAFSIHRRNFLRFVGITAIPPLWVLALQLAQVFVTTSSGLRKTPPDNLLALGSIAILGFFTGLIVYLVAYLSCPTAAPFTQFLSFTWVERLRSEVLCAGCAVKRQVYLEY